MNPSAQDVRRIAEGMAELVQKLTPAPPSDEHSLIGDFASLYAKCQMIRTAIDELLSLPFDAAHAGQIATQFYEIQAHLAEVSSMHADTAKPIATCCAQLCEMADDNE